MDDFHIDPRQWRFLDSPARYIERGNAGLELGPLTRQFRTAREILVRFADRHGILLADDVGLGKTTVGALVAWVTACQGMRVRIYAPNEVMRRRWAEELERHVPLLGALGASNDRIRQGDVGKLNAGRIQVATHRVLVKHLNHNPQRAECDLLIVDEAHRAKGERSAFNEALRKLADRAKRKLILTATPFSIRLGELEQLLGFVGATNLDDVRRYAEELKRLYILGDGHDPDEACVRLVRAAKAAVQALQPHVIRHGIDDLAESEQKCFGAIDPLRWEIATRPASDAELRLLLRMDRLLQLAPARKGERRNDPRFHIGWEHLDTELGRAADRAADIADHAAISHSHAARTSLRARRTRHHPKISAVSDAIRPVLDGAEKVLVFCHHRATASELLGALEQTLKVQDVVCAGPPANVWRAAWLLALPNDVQPANEPLVAPVVDWLCSAGVRRQIAGWLGKPKNSVPRLAEQLATTRPRASCREVPTITEAAAALIRRLVDRQSKSTRAVLGNMQLSQQGFGGGSHFPGRLDEGLRVMGTWHNDGPGSAPKSLYTGEPDIVLALFNSPFGPDVLVATDRLSEGVDLHRCCRHLIHYELDPSPVRTLQRNGRVRRVGSWAALTGRPIRYAYPTFGGTRDEKAVGIMRQRINAFGLLLGGVPALDDESAGSEQNFAELVLGRACGKLKSLNRKLKV